MPSLPPLLGDGARGAADRRRRVARLVGLHRDRAPSRRRPIRRRSSGTRSIAFWLVLWLVTPATASWPRPSRSSCSASSTPPSPGPVAWADQRFKLRRGAPIGWAQGFGILFDDFVAALCTLLVIAALEVRVSDAEAIDGLVARLAAALRARGATLATAESCTGGLIAAACTVARRLERLVRARLRHLLERRQERAARRRAGADRARTARSAPRSRARWPRGCWRARAARFAVAVTGIAGPGGGTPAKPVGTVWIAIAARGEEAEATLLQASGDRAAIRERVGRSRARAAARADRGDAATAGRPRRRRRSAATAPR